MIDLGMLVPFFTALLVLQLTPGPDMMLVVARGVGQGRSIAFLNVLGMVFVAGVLQIGLLVLGLSSVLGAHPAALNVLRWAGAAYLVYLGIKLLFSSGHPGPNGPWITTTQRPSEAVREGALSSMTNPKSLLFMFAFLPQFVDPTAGPVWVQLLLLGSLQKLVGLLVLGGVAMASGSIGQWINRWPGLRVWQARFTGSILIALGARLALSGDASGPRR
jgi:threonine/homoserine/homoserine lactone efflux protein